MKKILILVYRCMIPLLKGTGIGSLYPINLLLNHLKSDVSVVYNHKMFLDVSDTLGLSLNGSYEKFETELVKKEVQRGDVVLDIGANIGYYTLIFAKLVGEKGKVYAFEPDPTNFKLLKKNVLINGYKNVIFVQKAVSQKNGIVKLYLCDDNKGDHRIYDSGDDRDFLEIESIKLDDYFCGKNRKINFIKMDIQGAEGLALQGMTDILKRNDELKIISEFWPIGLKRAGTTPSSFLKLLLDHGFKLNELNEKNKMIIQITRQELLEKYKVSEESYTNLLCTRESR
ncbi:MAG: FkbM family methyltransferase [Candidatus Roizmanbacteria bacterium]|nr:FkbM family methyltransferase [Candidatus Roizmanbacteria bacterium]